MIESEFQSKLKNEIEKLLPGCVVLKNDPTFMQGIPDLIVIYYNKWAMLECKKSDKEPYRPNQEYYIDLFNRWSYASMICPENKRRVLYELQRSLKA